MHGVFLSPRYSTNKSIYLTYAALGGYGGGHALACAKLNATATSAKLENFEVERNRVPGPTAMGFLPTHRQRTPQLPDSA